MNSRYEYHLRRRGTTADMPWITQPRRAANVAETSTSTSASTAQPRQFAADPFIDSFQKFYPKKVPESDRVKETERPISSAMSLNMGMEPEADDDDTEPETEVIVEKEPSPKEEEVILEDSSPAKYFRQVKSFGMLGDTTPFAVDTMFDIFMELNYTLSPADAYKFFPPLFICSEDLQYLQEIDSTDFTTFGPILTEESMLIKHEMHNDELENWLRLVEKLLKDKPFRNTSQSCWDAAMNVVNPEEGKQPNLVPLRITPKANPTPEECAPIIRSTAKPKGSVSWRLEQKRQQEAAKADAEKRALLADRALTRPFCPLPVVDVCRRPVEKKVVVDTSSYNMRSALASASRYLSYPKPDFVQTFPREILPVTERWRCTEARNSTSEFTIVNRKQEYNFSKFPILGSSAKFDDTN